MKYLYTFCFAVLSTGLFAQTNYLIEYDKISDQLTYYQCDWIKGAQKQKKVQSIKINQNDVLTFRVVNLNNFVYDVSMLQQDVKKEQKESPFKTILSQFAGIGGPAFSLLTRLGSSAPDPFLGSRGGNKEEEEYKKRCTEILTRMDELMTNITKAYSDIEKSTEVLYSKEKTKSEILNELKSKQVDNNSSDIELDYEELLLLSSELEEMLEQEILDFDDPLWDDIDLIDELYYSFAAVCLTEDQALKPYDISELISEVENSTFSVEHKFLGLANSWNGKNTSNDFLIIFKLKPKSSDLGTEDDAALPIESAKFISLDVKQPTVPYWSLGVDYIVPMGGISEYNVQSIDGDYWLDTPDSLLVTTGSKKTIQLALGTKLNFEIPTNNRFVTPSAHFGVAISGLNNNDNDDWKLNFMIGSGITFKKFPFIALNAGVVFNQQKVLRNEYNLNRTFVMPTGYSNYSPDPAILFKNTFKPGLFFGVNLRL